ncbi:hypothetical protein [Bacillus sp. KH172YL63]|uniref:hypothetical protein n=1 Tax=Bacillus sp. KH172YL63 TaxID=2709784 RepID=UPI0013E51552|nr:hypothetical protein [Bacillus sp. KH172YL63]BCB04114.1 hypothetical protein KH172YL63_22470 [Bacillus sp. KH172YL63]
MKNEVLPKKWDVFKNIALVIILFISIRYLFDEEPFNDNLGWFAMVLFWIVKVFFDLIQNISKGDKKSMVGDVIFLAVGFGLLLWRGFKWLGIPPY